MKNLLRHGDVVLFKINEIPADAKSLGERKELAYGEVTGHAHRIDVGELFENVKGELFLKVDTLSNLSHEEHGTITLEKGTYIVVQKRIYTPDGWEKVRD